MTIAYRYHTHGTKVPGALWITNMLCSWSLHRFGGAGVPPIEKQCHAAVLWFSRPP